MPSADEEPRWLLRASASGKALGSAESLAHKAGVAIEHASSQSDPLLAAQCMGIECACFEKGEAMDIPAELTQVNITLMCAIDMKADGMNDQTPDAEAAFSQVVGYVVMQHFAPALIGTNSYAALQRSTLLITKLAVATTHRRRGGDNSGIITYTPQTSPTLKLLSQNGSTLGFRLGLADCFFVFHSCKLAERSWQGRSARPARNALGFACSIATRPIGLRVLYTSPPGSRSLTGASISIEQGGMRSRWKFRSTQGRALQGSHPSICTLTLGQNELTLRN